MKRANHVDTEVGDESQSEFVVESGAEDEETYFLENVLQVAAVGVAAVAGVAAVDSSSVKSDLRGPNPHKKKRIWARDWVLRRDPLALIYSEFSEEDPKKFYQCFRMSPKTFHGLLEKIFPYLLKKDTVRPSIKPNLRLMLTLRFLASGCDYGNLEDSFKIPKSTISSIVSETCEVIWKTLSKDFIKCPQTEAEWLEVADGFKVRLFGIHELKMKVIKHDLFFFQQKCNYPFAVGALDGKHCTIQCFNNTGSLFYNYKGCFSVVLLGISDANLKFLYVNIGVPGSRNDASIWNSCDFKNALEKGDISFPKVPRGNIPFHLLGDDAFGMTKNLMKPFPRSCSSLSKAEKVFNYRFSRGRRVVENAFGLLVSSQLLLHNHAIINFSPAFACLSYTRRYHLYHN